MRGHSRSRHKASTARKNRRPTSTGSTESPAQQTDTEPALLLFNKPFGVLCQFTDTSDRPTLANYLDAPGFYPAGRLDRDSEGLMLLTNDGKLQHRISDPRHKWQKTYLVQVDGDIDAMAVRELNDGITLKDGLAKAINARRVECPAPLWPRNPPVRFRQHIPTSWIELTLGEGRNRQVRRMTAAVGFPTLRLVRIAIADYEVWSLKPGEYRFIKPARAMQS